MVCDAERMVLQCHTCKKIRRQCARSRDVWPAATYPFQRLHMDWCDIKAAKKQVLVIVDSASGWIEAFASNLRITNVCCVLQAEERESHI